MLAKATTLKYDLVLFSKNGKGRRRRRCRGCENAVVFDAKNDKVQHTIAAAEAGGAKLTLGLIVY